MKFRSIVCLAAAAWWSAQTGLQAQPTNTPPSISSQLQELVQQIQAKANAGKNSEADFADEFKRYDELLAGENGAKTEEAAAIAFMKARLYLEVIKDYDKAAVALGFVATNYQGSDFSEGAMQTLDKIGTGLVGTKPGQTTVAVLSDIAARYPDNPYGNGAAEIVRKISVLEAAKKINDTLAVGTMFPDFTATNTDGKPISVQALKGKLVLLDFWATWCPNCVEELPTMIATYQKHHNNGFEIIGINLDQDRDKLNLFLKQHPDISWAQDFNAQDMAAKYGADLLPFTLLIAPNGKIIARELRGPALEMAVAEALALK